MTDKWNNFVNFLRPWTVGDFPLQSLQACLQSVLGSMLSEKLTIDGLSFTNQESSLVIKEIVGYDGDAMILTPFLPIRLMDLDGFLRVDMEKWGCNVGMTIGKEIKLYYHSESIKKTVCICQIKLDSNDINGNNFFSLLTADRFDSKAILDYCNELFKDINPEELVFGFLKPYLFRPDRKFKQLLQTELKNKGLEEEAINRVLKDLDISVSYKGQQKAKIQVEKENDEVSTSHDTTKFSIDGTNYLSKRNFVLTVVKQYVKDNPEITYEELNRFFRSDIISKVRGVVRPLAKVNEWIKTSPDLKKRYCLAENEIITLSTGEKVVVNNQWGKNTFPRFLNLIKNLYTISSDREYQDFPLTPCDEFLRENDVEKEMYSKGINISFGSLQNFKKENK